MTTAFITLHEIFEGDNMYYLVMDFMEGRTLQEEMDIMRVYQTIIREKPSFV